MEDMGVIAQRTSEEDTVVHVYAGMDSESKTRALFHVCREGLINVTDAPVVEAVANVNAKDLGGRTALMEAAWRGHTALIEMLVGTGGADVQAKNI